MLATVDGAMYGASQLFLLPVLLGIAALFAYAFFALGACVVQALQRRRGSPAGFELHQARARQPHLDAAALELLALRRLEMVRVSTRVAPMLGLVATMIPMGPALKALADGKLEAVSQGLTMAFSAVILALVAAAITYTIAQVRRRWYASELLVLAGSGEGAP